MENSDRILLKDELMKALWPDSFVEDSNLTQQVSAVRKALGETAGQDGFIVTVPGKGYRFNAAVREPIPEKPADVPRRRLGGSIISVLDSAGVLRLGQMFLASPGQVNFFLPAPTAAGPAQITVTSASGSVATGTVDVAAVQPSIFALSGTTVAAAVAVRVSSVGVQTPVAVFQCTGSACSAAPMDLGAAGDSVFLTLFGTGLRKNSGLANVRATIGGATASVVFAGAQGEFPGLDQVNVQVPDSLRGRGEIALAITVDGQTTNTVTINVR